MRIKKISWLVGGVLGLALGLNWIQTLATPSNPILEGPTTRITRGSSYWATSNLREWLNSSDIQVDYTSNPPSNELTNGNGYDEEPGFLSQFTDYELNQIAITEHRIPLNSFDRSVQIGGGSQSPHFNNLGPIFLSNYSWAAFSFKQYAYRSENDKLFLLNAEEMYWYLTQRGISYIKSLTPEAAQKNGTSISNVNWWFNGSFDHQGTDLVGATTGNLLYYHNAPDYKLGVVPAMHLKPDTILSTGERISDFKIGDILTFGTYLNAPIKWQIINITENNYPLLLALNVLDMKVFDAKGDYSKRDSEVLNFNKEIPDVSILNNIQFRPTNESTDIEMPVFNVVDDSLLYARQNNPYTLTIEVLDKGSGLDYIILPNGEQITTPVFNYTFTENKNYVFTARDKAGNYADFLIPVNNINESQDISIVPSTTDWTNQKISIDIRSNTTVNLFQKKINLSTGSSWGSKPFRNYISYSNQTFKITGKVRLLNYKEGAEAHKLGIGFMHEVHGKNPYSYTVTGFWGANKYIEIKDLIKQNEIEFEFLYTIKDNYYNNLKAYISIPRLNEYPGDYLEVELLDVKYELINDSDIAINEIELPSGESIKESEYLDYISTEGIHDWTYRVTDNRGMITEKTITTKIDRTLPQLTITPDAQNDDTYEKTYHIQASDNLSGIQRLEYRLTGATTQDWTTYEGDSLSLTIEKAGTTTLTVRAYDVAGNRKEQAFTVQVDDEVLIEDDQLAQVIRQTVGLATDEPVFKSHMEALTELEAPNQQITNLTGLETAKQLKKLTLPANEIQDLTPIATLSRLEVLVLDENPIQDIESLAQLNRLQTLSLNQIQVTDWSPLSKLSELRELNVAHNDLNDLSFAKNFKKIKRLDLSFNQIDSVEDLTLLSSLENLNLSNNQIQDLSPLQSISVNISASNQNILYEVLADEDLSFHNPMKNQDGSYIPLEFNEPSVVWEPDYSRFKVNYSFLNKMPIQVGFKGQDGFEGVMTLNLKSDLEQIPQDLAITGQVEPLILTIEVPSEVALMIDANQEIPFIAPEFEIRNKSNAPLNLSLQPSELLSDQLQLVPLDRYSETEWDLLNKEHSKQLAIGLQIGQSGNLIDVSESQSQELGVLRPYTPLDVRLVARHGRAFETQMSFKIRLTFIFELLS